MTPKAPVKIGLAGAFGVEGSRAQGNTQPRLRQLQGSFKKGVITKRRYLSNCERLKHSLCCVRTFTSLLDHFHHAKERRKLKMGVQILYVPKLAVFYKMYFVLCSKAAAGNHARNQETDMCNRRYLRRS